MGIRLQRSSAGLAICVAILLVGISGCDESVSDGGDTEAAAAPDSPEEPSAESTDPSPNNLAQPAEAPFDEQLLKIGSEYLSYGLVDPMAAFAPVLCSAAPGPPKARLSRSDEESSHGRKLYYLFAAKNDNYVDPKRKSSPVGQVLVKEAWTAKETETPEVLTFEDHACGSQVTPWANLKDQFFRADKKKALFVMMKLDPQTPGTDQGWVYGTLSPDDTEVTGAGKLQNCIDCHQEAPNDRLFGTQL